LARNFHSQTGLIAVELGLAAAASGGVARSRLRRAPRFDFAPRNQTLLPWPRSLFAGLSSPKVGNQGHSQLCEPGARAVPLPKPLMVGCMHDAQFVISSGCRFEDIVHVRGPVPAASHYTAARNVGQTPGSYRPPLSKDGKYRVSEKGHLGGILRWIALHLPAATAVACQCQWVANHIRKSTDLHTRTTHRRTACRRDPGRRTACPCPP
jgi:hypothetical protein